MGESFREKLHKSYFVRSKNINTVKMQCMNTDKKLLTKSYFAKIYM
jgi:hypothetical protein